MNRLAKESSPYLLQHAHNPVDWYPWGPEAFAAARSQDKPIFLSVGYSTCYWCHVMERQCFEVEAIAAEMNHRFINIKVDREQRPDVDQLYMLAVQVLTRQGGWPMSIFLTPDLKPFYGGTYFPPTDAHGRPGFLTVLAAVEDAYRNRKGDIAKTSAQLVEILEEVAQPAQPTAALAIDQSFIDQAVQESIADYDRIHGGFGHAPKFPRQTLLELLLVYSDASKKSEERSQKTESQILSMVLHTLDSLAAGGIRDHLSGGFHRYSTDERWLVPHFEIMLYDNAMLAWCYVEAFRQSGEQRFASVARGILDFVLGELTSPDGSFYTALDAETDAQEGASYLWTAEQVAEILGAEDARLFNGVYGLELGPNFADPHQGTGRPDRNVLYLPRPLAVVAHEMGIDEDALNARLAPLRQKLLEVRNQRKQPLLDRKIITSWNGLMVRAFAHASQVFQEQRYVDAATRAARFLLDHHTVPGGRLIHTTGGGLPNMKSEISDPMSSPSFLDDYAFLAQALLALHRATADPQWHTQAGTLADAMIARFGDAALGGFFFTEAGVPDIIVRQKTASDSPLPSGNAVAILALLELGRADSARSAIEAFAQHIHQQPEGSSALVQAALAHLRLHGPVTVIPGQSPAPDRPLSLQELAERVVTAAAVWQSPTELDVQVDVLTGYHINASQASPDLVPTTLAVDPPAGRIEFPPPVRRRLAFAAEDMDIYEGRFIVRVTFASPPGPDLRITLRYQACDETSCLPPVQKQIAV